MRLILALLLMLMLIMPALAQEASPLAQASAPVSVGLQMRGEVYEARVEVTEPTRITLWCPVIPGLIGLTGFERKADVTYDRKTRTLVLSLQPGKYTITIRSL